MGAGSLAIGLLMQRMTSLPKRKVLSTGIQMFAAALMLLLVAMFAGEFAGLHLSEISTQA